MNGHLMSGLVMSVVTLVGFAGAANSTGIAAHPLPAGEILVTGADAPRSPTRPDLYLIKPDGSHLRLLLRNAADAAASRDGRQIAFARDGAIWISQRDGSGARRVTWPSAGVVDDQPTWSRDGKTLYFSRSSSASGLTASLFAIGTDGRGVRQLTWARQSGHEPACNLWPSTSPDGRTVVYTVISFCGHGGRSIAAVTTTGHRVKLGFRLPSPGPQIGYVERFSAAWAPKRPEIAYSVVNSEQNSAWAYVSASNGSLPQRIFFWDEKAGDGGPEGLDSPPAWSSDGRALVLIPPVAGFLHYPKYAPVGRGDVWFVSADGLSQQQLTKTGMFTAAAWLPPVGVVGG